MRIFNRPAGLSLIISGLIILAIGFISCDSDVKPIDPDIIIKKELLLKDFAQFRRTMKESHPSLQNAKGGARVQEMFDQYEAQIDRDMTVSEFYVLIRKASAFLNCGHTRLWLSKGHWLGIKTHKKHFPFRVFYQDYKAYIRQDFSDEQIIPEGSEIVSINDVLTIFISAGFKSIIGSDGLNETYRVAEMNRVRQGLFPGYIEFPDTYTVSYTEPRDTVVKTAEIAALPYDTIRERRHENYPPNDPWPPITYYQAKNGYYAVIKIHDFVSAYDYQDVISGYMNSLLESSIERLVIDIRDNDGGDPYVASMILNYIIDSSYTYFASSVYGYDDLKGSIEPYSPNFDGNVYILADGGSFSTSGHFLSLVKYHDLGTIYGDTSGGSYWCNGCYEELKLDNTEIQVMYPQCRYATAVKGVDGPNGIAPDVFFKTTIYDILSGKDYMLKLAIK